MLHLWPKFDCNWLLYGEEMDKTKSVYQIVQKVYTKLLTHTQTTHEGCCHKVSSYGRPKNSSFSFLFRPHSLLIIQYNHGIIELWSHRFNILSSPFTNVFLTRKRSGELARATWPAGGWSGQGRWSGQIEAGASQQSHISLAFEA